jgi:hypothetical protein
VWCNLKGVINIGLVSKSKLAASFAVKVEGKSAPSSRNRAPRPRSFSTPAHPLLTLHSPSTHRRSTTPWSHPGLVLKTVPVPAARRHISWPDVVQDDFQCAVAYGGTCPLYHSHTYPNRKEQESLEETKSPCPLLAEPLFFTSDRAVYYYLCYSRRST